MSISKNINKIIFCLFVVVLSSCDPSKRINKDYLYFQNNRELVVKARMEELTIKPKDILAIQIYSNSLNQEQVAIFNITAAQGYPVNLEGKIEIPIIGEVTAAGLTRDQLQRTISIRLKPYVKDPAVLVKFQPFSINILGEVAGPGAKTFTTDKVTILDAIGSAGDLTPTGVRENVIVIRENNGVKQMYEIDLRSAALFESPVYQLHNGDIVYVNANKAKLKSLKEKTDFSRILQTGVSLIGVATSLYLLFVR